MKGRGQKNKGYKRIFKPCEDLDEEGEGAAKMVSVVTKFTVEYSSI